MNTVDFKIIKKPESVFDLYVADKTGLSLFASTKVSKIEYDFYKDESIVEFSYNGDKWNPVKLRPDKETPNFITVAQDNLQSFLSPFVAEDVFTEKVALFNLRRFHNFIKRKYIDKYKSKSVLDLAVGKGGDLGKYNDSGFSIVHGYDIDIPSIKEAKQRADMISKKQGNNIEITLEVKDLIKNSIPSGKIKFDLIVTNFAFHYFYKSLPTYIKTVTNNLKNGGHLILSFFKGEKLIETKNNLYEIKKISTDKVSVWMKDSVLNKPTVEYIVDVNSVIKKFKKFGLLLVENVEFKELYPEWQKYTSKNILSVEEKKLSFINNILVFKYDESLSMAFDWLELN
jgi:SAM-dependent methyltransferase